VTTNDALLAYVFDAQAHTARAMFALPVIWADNTVVYTS
jgi:hypothetical protein